MPPVAVTLKLAPWPTLTRTSCGWVLIASGVGVPTVSTAPLDVTLMPLLLVTTTLKAAPLSSAVAAGAV